MKKSLALSLAICASGAAFAAVPANTLVIQQAADIETLDPSRMYDTSSGMFVENIYETLLAYKGGSIKEVESMLATDYKISNGGKTYVFTLRKGVKFHSGNTMTCDDAEYTFRRNLVTNSVDSGQWFFSESMLGTGANAKDDPSITWARIAKAVSCNNQGQLVFNLPKADPAFLVKLVFPAQSVVDMKHAAKIGEWDGTEKTWKEWAGKDLVDSALNKTPSGTGAYQLVKRDANTIILKSFDGYWGKKPAIDNVLFQVVKEQATRLEALKRGDADLIETGPRSVLTQLQGVAGLRVIDDLPNTVAQAFFMNQSIKDTGLLGSGKLDGKGIPATFFSNTDVRKAFSYAFDYNRYIKEVQVGKGIQRTMLLPDSFSGYSSSVRKYSYDAQRARAFFQKAYGGELWKNGFVLKTNYRAGSVGAQTAMEILKKNVEAINPKFKVDIQSKQWSEMLKDSKDGKEAMVIMGWAPDYADPDNFMYTFYSSNGYYFPRSGFKDAQTDKWLEQARNTVDQKRRTALYAQVGNRAFELAPYILVPAAVNFSVVRDNLKGVSKESYNPMIGNAYTGTYFKELSK